MPITYAGVELSPPAHAQALVNNYWHGHRIDEFEYQPYFLPKLQHLPIPYIPKREAPVIGRLYWPTGANMWSLCHLVATGSQIERIRTTVGTNPSAQTLTITDGNNTISTLMYHAVRPISQRGDSYEQYLLTLFDDRWWWFQTGSTDTPTAAASWNSLISQLFAIVGVTPTIGTIHTDYLVPNMVRWNVGSQPIPLVIEAVCRQVGMRVVRKLDGAVHVVPYATAASEDTTRWSIIQNLVLAGGRLKGADLGRISPASVDVAYFDGTVDNKTLVSLSLADYESVQGVTSKVGLVTADPEEMGVSERAAYTTQAAKDYYNWFLAKTDCSLRGIQNIDPVGLDEFVEWTHYPDQMLTRIVRPQWSDRNIYGEKAASADGTGEAPEYKDECIDGSLVRKKATVYLTADGLQQTSYEVDEELGVPCTGGMSGSGLTGSGAGFVPSPAGVLMNAVIGVCPIIGTTRPVTTDYEMTRDDFKIEANGTFTVTLPPWRDGDFYIIVNTGSGTITIDTYGGLGTINGVASVTLTTQWESKTFDTLSTENKWFVS